LTDHRSQAAWAQLEVASSDIANLIGFYVISLVGKRIRKRKTRKKKRRENKEEL
jgi:hypothetical protein